MYGLEPLPVAAAVEGMNPGQPLHSRHVASRDEDLTRETRLPKEPGEPARDEVERLQIRLVPEAAEEQEGPRSLSLGLLVELAGVAP